MKKPFFKIVLFAAVALAILPAAGNYCAQTTSNPVAKRNSPFSPNPPKKKVETAKQNPEQVKNTTTAENPVTTGNANLSINNGSNSSNNGASQTQSNQPNETPKQDAEFESRSVAKKTLDVVKRKNSVTASPTEIYKIGAGDVLDIRILNSPGRESTLFTVLESGAIDYPLAAGEEPVAVAGLTSDEIEDLLKQRVKLYENPQISVTVRDYASHTISVLGLVEKPGMKALRREAIPLYVIMAEAIPQPSANKATILRAADKQTITVNLEDNETLIYPNDIVRVISGGGGKNSSGQSQFYYIGGEIVSAGQKEFHEGITLTQAILACGGLKKSSVRKVVIRRKDAQGRLVPTEYDLKFIKEGKIADPLLEAGDTVEIDN